MKVLIDTNILIRLSDRASGQHPFARDAVDALESHGHELLLVPQVLHEFWAVATRPIENNGLGLTTEIATESVKRWMAVFHPMRDERGIFQLWQGLVTLNDVKGKNAHDARLAAAMQRHGVTHVLTFNRADFARFPSVVALSPEDIMAGIVP